jgi:pyridoxamine 5'-phosphate oxidase
MERAEVIAFINANQSCHLATVEDGVPKVRGMAAYRADDQGVLFHTGTFKTLYRQLLANPTVEMCFNSAQAFKQVRVSGRAVLVDDMDLKREIVEARPFLKGLIKGDTFEGFAVFRVVDAKVNVWTMPKNQEPTVYQPW